MSFIDPPLLRAEMKKVIVGKGAARRVPMSIHSWIKSETFGERGEEYRVLLQKYPSDLVVIPLRLPHLFNPPQDDPSYRWLNFDNPFPSGMALDAMGALQNWDSLDAVLADFPTPYYPGLIPEAIPPDDGVYSVGLWWYWLFERLWSIRGMENALCDLYEEGDKVHRLFRALTDFYKVMIRRGKECLGLDAVWTSDDIGTQTSTFFSQDIFREYFKPYYKELIDYAHSLDMHFWLHSCGNITSFMPDLIEIGLDVLHPIQKYSMNEREIAQKYGGQICIWAGMDVQRTIPYGSQDDVRREVRFMMDTYFRSEGRFIITAGNNMTADTPLENLHAFLSETLAYGAEICGKSGG